MICNLGDPMGLCHPVDMHGRNTPFAYQFPPKNYALVAAYGKYGNKMTFVKLYQHEVLFGETPQLVAVLCNALQCVAVYI